MFQVMERNARNHLAVIDQSGQKMVTNLSSFFPFDPYLLTRSSPFVLPHYREYEALEQPGDAPSDSEDDGICEEKTRLRNRHPSLKSMSPGSLTHIVPSPKSFTEMFSYGSSPGFKHY
jgi:RNA polymerase I specific transcription initiation factor RRN3